jgi:hypothetical protein
VRSDGQNSATATCVLDGCWSTTSLISSFHVLVGIVPRRICHESAKEGKDERRQEDGSCSHAAKAEYLRRTTRGCWGLRAARCPVFRLFALSCFRDRHNNDAEAAILSVFHTPLQLFALE